MVGLYGAVYEYIGITCLYCGTSFYLGLPSPLATSPLQSAQASFYFISKIITFFSSLTIAHTLLYSIPDKNKCALDYVSRLAYYARKLRVLIYTQRHTR